MDPVPAYITAFAVYGVVVSGIVPGFAIANRFFEESYRWRIGAGAIIVAANALVFGGVMTANWLAGPAPLRSLPVVVAFAGASLIGVAGTALSGLALSYPIYVAVRWIRPDEVIRDEWGELAR